MQTFSLIYYFQDYREKTMANDTYIKRLLAANSLRESTLREMIATLKLPKGSRGLDAGCGIGLQCLLMADAVGATGHITGLDISREMLDYGRKIIKDAGLADRISLQEGSITGLPFDDNTFDWTWSADCVGYAPMPPLPLLEELVRVVKPGGTIAITAWSSEKLLPGYPLLEARLGTTSAGIAPFTSGKEPELHFMRALGWFQRLGLSNPQTMTFAGSVYAPLNPEIRTALEDLFTMRWPDISGELSPDDLSEFQRLCLPDSPDFILDLSDYCAFFTYTMFWGNKL
jgi:demethylmenaquinone methyltransferase/2-methoxy-6-polyprenyl-1,4-benzoquinol methylase